MLALTLTLIFQDFEVVIRFMLFRLNVHFEPHSDFHHSVAQKVLTMAPLRLLTVNFEQIID